MVKAKNLASILQPEWYKICRNPSYTHHLLHISALVELPVQKRLIYFSCTLLFWLSLMLRFLASYLALISENVQYFDVDLLCRVIASGGSLPELFLAFSLLPLFAFLFYWQIFFQTHSTFWKNLIRMTVRNTEHFWQKFPNLKPHEREGHFIGTYLLGRLRTMQTLWHGNFVLNKQLSYASILNQNRLQAKLIALIQFFDCFYYAYNYIFALVLPGILALPSLMLGSFNLFATIDLCIESIHIYTAANAITLALQSCMALNLMSLWSGRQMNCLMQTSRVHLSSYLPLYYRRYLNQTTLVGQINRSLLSPLSFYYLLTNLTLSTCLLSQMIQGRNLNVGHVFFFGLFLLGQLFIFYLFYLVMVPVNQAFAKESTHLHHVQQLLQTIPEKLKFETQYEAIHCGKFYLGYTIGPNGLATPRYAVEIILMYLAFLFYFCKLTTNENRFNFLIVP